MANPAIPAPPSAATDALTGYASTPGLPPFKPSKGILGAARDFIRGLWQSKATPDKPLGPQIEEYIEQEKLAAGPRGIVLPWFLPWIGDYTHETPEMRLAYREMLRDPNVKAALLHKLFSVASRDINTTPASTEPKDKKDPEYQQKLAQFQRDKEGADFVKDALSKCLKGGVRRLVEAIGYGLLIDGYSVCEKVAEIEDRGQWSGKYVIRQLKSKDTNYDVIPLVDEFRNVVGIKGIRYNAGEIFHPANFVLASYLPLFENPGGMSDLRAVYARYWMLDTVLKLRIVCSEKRAIPILLGQYATAQQQPALEQALTDARFASWITVPLQTRVEAVNIAGQADDIFANFVKDLKHDIILGIAGAILQQVEGTISDARGSSQVHESTSDLLNWYLSALIASVVNEQVVPDLIDLNFVDTGYPIVSLTAIDENELQAALKIDIGLHQLGADLSKEDLYKRYGRTPPLDDQDRLAGAPPQAAAGAGGAGSFPDKGGVPSLALQESNGVRAVPVPMQGGHRPDGTFRNGQRQWQRPA